MKTCLVTGGASGIGFAIAKKFAEEKFNVVIADMNLEAAQKAADELATQGIKTLAVAMNVTDEAAVAAGFKKTVETFGQVNVVVNNAGLQIISPLHDFDLKNWKLVQDVQLTGGFLVSKAAIQAMKKNADGGSILFIGSIHSFLASKNKAAYVTAKHGLMGLMRAIAKEGGEHHIRSNLVAPGFVKTPLLEKQIPEQAEQLGISEEEVVKNVMLGQTVDGEFSSLEDVANVTHYLATFPTLALTGQSMLVTHGWHMS